MKTFGYLTRKFINRCGFEVRRIGTARPCRSMAGVLANVARLGFVPNIVIDVGVAKGTFALYEAFPNAYHLLVEPLEEFEDDIISILKKYKGSYD